MKKAVPLQHQVTVEETKVHAIPLTREDVVRLLRHAGHGVPENARVVFEGRSGERGVELDEAPQLFVRWTMMGKYTEEL